MSPEQFSALIARDELALRGVLRRFLADDGSVEEVRTVGQACKSILLCSVDLLIPDINEMSRDAAMARCRGIRDPGQNVGILPIIERGFEKNIVQILETSGDDYITKPFRASEVIGRCHVYCDALRPALEARRLPSPREICS